MTIATRSWPGALAALLSVLCTPAFLHHPLAHGGPAALGAAPPAQIAAYEAEVRKTMLELQPFRQTTTAAIRGPAGRAGTATLVQLNPTINAWMLLTLEWEGAAAQTYHLENTAPEEQHLALDPGRPDGIVVSTDDRRFPCALWSSAPETQLEQARQTDLPYASLCNGRILLRNRVTGHRTALEQMTDLLRDGIPGGETIIGFVRQTLYRNAFLEQGLAPAPDTCPAPTADMPLPAEVNENYRDRAAVPEHLGIRLAERRDQLVLGCWYPVNGLPGIHLSAMQPGAVTPEILASYRDIVKPLDAVEASALVYLVAFDLERFDLGFELGTDHPRLDWSPRAQPGVRTPGLPGPDGIDRADPVVTMGMVSPVLSGRTVATFTGGFKRSHSAFRYGEFAQKHHGSHYGFISNGTIFSKLHPGLATLYVLDDGSVDITTWTDEDDRLLGNIRHARQNGVPIIRYDPASGTSTPGALVARWGPGNWSGSAEGKLRSLRAGACLQETPHARFLIYGYFSAATPSAMARVFQAYGCRDAMLLDMNALEHTYLALYRRDGKRVSVEHLIAGMTEVDKEEGGELVPRFIGFADNRDFFYVVPKDP